MTCGRATSWIDNAPDTAVVSGADRGGTRAGVLVPTLDRFASRVRGRWLHPGLTTHVNAAELCRVSLRRDQSGQLREVQPVDLVAVERRRVADEHGVVVGVVADDGEVVVDRLVRRVAGGLVAGRRH